MRVFDFFGTRELVRPAVGCADAEAIASERFGISGNAHELGSQQDRNFRIRTSDGTDYLLKVDNPAFTSVELASQTTALEYLTTAGLRVPSPIPGRDGEALQTWVSNGQRYTVRMFTFVDGRPLAAAEHLSSDAIRALGRLSATVARELADFRAPGLDRNLQWDLRNAREVVGQLIGHVRAPEQRAAILAAADRAAERLRAVEHELRVQAIHGDVTDDNVMSTTREDGRAHPEGVIDFGDLAYSWLVAELAVTASSVLHHTPQEPHRVFEAIRAFHEVVPLSDAEISALWPLIVLRGAVLVVSGEHQVQLEAENLYAVERMAAEWRVFETASAIGWDEAEAAIRIALGVPETTPPVEFAPAAPMLAGIAAGDYAIVDLSVTSEHLHAGAWLQPDAEWIAAASVLTNHTVAVAPYGIHRLTRATRNSVTPPPTLALVTDLFLEAGEPVSAPMDAQVLEAGEDGMSLAVSAEGGSAVLRLSGILTSLAPGATVRAGALLGRVRAQDRAADAEGLGRLRVQLTRPGVEAPNFTTAPWARAWMSLAPDPATLIGVAPMTKAPDADDELGRRARIFADAQERYYERPPQFERGWREHLIDTTGRTYLDMVNNVTSIGHAHPRMAEAVGAQLRTLNTNSRFLYRALADLSERIIALAPHESLDTVLLVNSGTEAVDLALRMARIHTGRRDVVALREAYHGWSMGADAVSTSAFDNPNALHSRPDWVHLADIPNPYRGRYRGSDAGSRYADDVDRLLDELSASGHDVGAFICEPVLGNAGGVLIPDGYLDAVYRQVRSRGGLCIADEVQVGYGRLGEHFWGVQQQGVVPDIIAVAKAMGNGYPLGAVITRREIADSLAREGNFFSSAGGSPVSCVAGSVVIDVIRDEGLQENARTVGTHLKRRLQELAGRHPLIGSVHGLGLYLGIELVRDRETLEPAVAETAAICERLLELGVIMQATSERQNVLKVKPPLCLSVASADFFVDALDTVLSAGW